MPKQHQCPMIARLVDVIEKFRISFESPLEELEEDVPIAQERIYDEMSNEMLEFYAEQSLREYEMEWERKEAAMAKSEN